VKRTLSHLRHRFRNALLEKDGQIFVGDPYFGESRLPLLDIGYMLNTSDALKKSVTQRFLEDGKRIATGRRVDSMN
jgi:hypothetical protein